jgi:hypothetical protein
MKSNIAERYLSEADYLAGEQDRQIRHEFIAGTVYTMTWASGCAKCLLQNQTVGYRRSVVAD